jgi:hypothetical protein
MRGILLVALCVPAVLAVAQDGGRAEGPPQGAIANAVVRRPLTLPAGVVAVSPGLLVGNHVGTSFGGTHWGGTIRAAVGLHRQLEVAIEPVPFTVGVTSSGPALGPGDPQLWSPRFETTAHVFGHPGTVDWAFRGGATFPVPDDRLGLRHLEAQHRANRSFYLHVGTFARIPAERWGRIDVGGRVAVLTDADAPIVTEGRLEALVQPLEALALGLRIAAGGLLGDSNGPLLFVDDLGGPGPLRWYATLGMSATFTVRTGSDGPPIDVFVDLLFPRWIESRPFVELDIAPDVSTFPGDPVTIEDEVRTSASFSTTQINIGVTFHLDPTGAWSPDPDPPDPT